MPGRNLPDSSPTRSTLRHFHVPTDACLILHRNVHLWHDAVHHVIISASGKICINRADSSAVLASKLTFKTPSQSRDPSFVKRYTVDCPFFGELTDEHSRSLISDADHILSNPSLPNHISLHLLHMVTNFLKDDVSWPLGLSRFYLGLIPHLLPPATSQESLSVDSNRLVTHLAHSCHQHGIRLAARIWGIIVCHYVSGMSPSRVRGRLDRHSLLHNSNLTLPDHLQYLLHL